MWQVGAGGHCGPMKWKLDLGPSIWYAVRQGVSRLTPVFLSEPHIRATHPSFSMLSGGSWEYPVPQTLKGAPQSLICSLLKLTLSTTATIHRYPWVLHWKAVKCLLNVHRSIPAHRKQPILIALLLQAVYLFLELLTPKDIMKISFIVAGPSPWEQGFYFLLLGKEMTEFRNQPQ